MTSEAVAVTFDLNTRKFIPTPPEQMAAVIDAMVDGVGGVVVAAGTVLRLFQNGYVGTYAFFFVLGVVILLIQLVM